MIQHVVLFKWKPEVTAQQQANALEKLSALPEKIPGIANLSSGKQCSIEGLDKGFQYGFVMTFRTVGARNDYLPHPEHQKVVEVLKPLLADIVVLDYEF